MTLQYILQVLTTLALLGVTLYVLYRVTNTLQRKRYSGDIDIIDRRPIDASTALIIVKVRGKDYLMSSGTKGLQVLDQL
ncbi:MAG: hypothetical protein O3A01_01055 [bacterium]|nr:hypothetical protein [bacterium]